MSALLELAGYFLVGLAIIYVAILIVMYIVMPFMAWVLSKVLER